MAVVVTVGTNSYISVADATLYFADRLYSDAWTNAAADDKAKALIMATKKIDQMHMLGVKAVTNQTLEFPRALYSYSDQVRLNIVGAADLFYGPNWVIETEVSQVVKDATCEQAIFLLKGGVGGNKRAELQAQGVKSFSLGNLSESFVVGRKGGMSLEAIELMQKYLGPVMIV